MRNFDIVGLSLSYRRCQSSNSNACACSRTHTRTQTSAQIAREHGRSLCWGQLVSWLAHRQVEPAQRLVGPARGVRAVIVCVCVCARAYAPAVHEWFSFGRLSGATLEHLGGCRGFARAKLERIGLRYGLMGVAARRPARVGAQTNEST